MLTSVDHGQAIGSVYLQKHKPYSLRWCGPGITAPISESAGDRVELPGSIAHMETDSSFSLAQQAKTLAGNLRKSLHRHSLLSAVLGICAKEKEPVKCLWERPADVWYSLPKRPCRLTPRQLHSSRPVPTTMYSSPLSSSRPPFSKQEPGNLTDCSSGEHSRVLAARGFCPATAPMIYHSQGFFALTES